MLTSIDVKFIFDSTRLSSGKPIEHFLVDDQFEFRHFILYIYIYTTSAGEGVSKEISCTVRPPV